MTGDLDRFVSAVFGLLGRIQAIAESGASCCDYHARLDIIEEILLHQFEFAYIYEDDPSFAFNMPEAKPK